MRRIHGQPGVVPLLVTLFVIVLAPSPVRAVGDDERNCTECHPKLGDRLGGEILHEPFREQDCLACHAFHGFNNSMVLAGEVYDMCVACHFEIFEVVFDELHAPLQDDPSCAGCHDPHGADLPDLLKSPGNDLCVECHDGDDGSAASTHAPFAAGECLGCHDPHGTEATANLVFPAALLCASCHVDIVAPEELPDMHTADGDDVCGNCHVGHASGDGPLLQESVPDLCVACHDDLAAAFASDFPHAAVEECTSCHDPHRPHEAAERTDLCAECHDLEDTDFVDLHGEVDGGECIECHDPHASTQEFLLRD